MPVFCQKQVFFYQIPSFDQFTYFFTKTGIFLPKNTHFWQISIFRYFSETGASGDVNNLPPDSASEKQSNFRKFGKQGGKQRRGQIKQIGLLRKNQFVLKGGGAPKCPTLAIDSLGPTCWYISFPISIWHESPDSFTQKYPFLPENS